MITGIGVDIIEVDRIVQALSRHGDQFANRILSDPERLDYAQAAHKARFLAKRFAMKEALAKAIGTGIRGEVSFKKITIQHDVLGKPSVMLADSLQSLFAGLDVHVSVSDEKNTVVAFVVIQASHR